MQVSTPHLLKINPGLLLYFLCLISTPPSSLVPQKTKATWDAKGRTLSRLRRSSIGMGNKWADVRMRTSLSYNNWETKVKVYVAEKQKVGGLRGATSHLALATFSSSGECSKLCIWVVRNIWSASASQPGLLISHGMAKLGSTVFSSPLPDDRWEHQEVLLVATSPPDWAAGGQAVLTSPTAWNRAGISAPPATGSSFSCTPFSLCLTAWSLPWRAAAECCSMCLIGASALADACSQGCVILTVLSFQNVCDLMQLPCGSWNTSIKTDRNKTQLDPIFFS